MKYLITFVVLIVFHPFIHSLSNVPHGSEISQLCKKKKHHSSPPPVIRLKQNIPEWAQAQIDRDFAIYKDTAISLEKIDDLFQRRSADWLLVKFTISANQLVVENNNQDNIVEWRAKKFASAITALCKHAILPNMTFLISMHDSFTIDPAEIEGVPLFGMAKNNTDRNIILIPDFEALSDNKHLFKEVNEGKKYAWGKKIARGIWRGATTGRVITPDTFLTLPRSQAVTTSLHYPELVNARFNLLVQCSDSDTVRRNYAGYFGGTMSISEQLQYKYQLLIDGNSCAYSRSYWQLFSNCVIFKQSSPDIQWFYGALQPYVHYIPLEQDVSDLVEKILWARSHDDEAKTIMLNARNFAEANLTREQVHFYLYLVLKEYGSHQQTP